MTNATTNDTSSILKEQIAEALFETSYSSLAPADKQRIRMALVVAATITILEVLNEAATVTKEGSQTISEKPSLAYLKRALECAAAASPNAKEAALAIDLMREASDRVAAMECVQFDSDLVPGILHTGADGDQVFVSPDGAKGGAPAALLAELIGVSIHALVCDCWIASREEHATLRAIWLKNAGRRED